MKRLIEQSACVHRQFNVCTFLLDSGDPCPGGTSREVTVDYEAAESLFDEGEDLYWLNSSRLAVDALVRKIVDAALGGGW